MLGKLQGLGFILFVMDVCGVLRKGRWEGALIRFIFYKDLYFI